MSLKNKRQRKSDVNLFFNQRINIFPKDFFSTFEKNNNSTTEKSRNIPHPKIILPRFKENPKQNPLINTRSQNKSNDELIKTNFCNVIKLENICNFDFSFQAPPTPDKKKNINNQKGSLPTITKNHSFQPLFRSPFNEKIEKYDFINNSAESPNKDNHNKNNDNKINNINSNNTHKFKRYNIKFNELYKESKLKFLKNKNIKSIGLVNKKEKEKYINLNMTSKLNEKNRNKYTKYRISTPVIKNRVIKKILNINKSKEITLKCNSLKSININNKNSVKEEEKIIKKKEIPIKSSSLKHMNNKKEKPIFDTEKIPISKNKIFNRINNLNKRALSSKNYNKNNKIELNNDKNNKSTSNNSKVNKTQNNTNSKNIMKKNIKSTIEKIFKEMPRDYEDNPVLIYKFKSLIRNMKNFQHIIKNKKNSLRNDKNFELYKKKENENEF